MGKERREEDGKGKKEERERERREEEEEEWRGEREEWRGERDRDRDRHPNLVREGTCHHTTLHSYVRVSIEYTHTPIFRRSDASHPSLPHFALFTHRSSCDLSLLL